MVARAFGVTFGRRRTSPSIPWVDIVGHSRLRAPTGLRARHSVDLDRSIERTNAAPFLCTCCNAFECSPSVLPGSWLPSPSTTLSPLLCLYIPVWLYLCLYTRTQSRYLLFTSYVSARLSLPPPLLPSPSSPIYVSLSLFLPLALPPSPSCVRTDTHLPRSGARTTLGVSTPTASA